MQRSSSFSVTSSNSRRSTVRSGVRAPGATERVGDLAQRRDELKRRFDHAYALALEETAGR